MTKRLLYRVIKAPMLACVCFVAALPSSASAADRLVSDPSTGCKVYLSDAERPGTVVSWSGACGPDGFAHGDGVLNWMEGGRVVTVARFEKAGGLIMDHGRMRLDIPANAVTADFNSSGTRCGSISAVVAPAVDLAFFPVVNAIIDQLLRNYNAACRNASGQIEMLRVTINYTGQESRGIRSDDIVLSVLRNGERQYHGFSSAASQEAKVMAANQRLAAENQRREVAEREAAKAVFNQRAAEIRQGFYSNIAVSPDAPPLNSLSANPFVHNGKTASYVATFMQMVTAQDALFVWGNNAFILRGAPPDLLRERGDFVVAGKVDGNTTYSSGVVPVLRHVKLYRCAQSRCEDFVGKR